MHAEYSPAQESFLSWIFNSLGLRYTFLIPLAALFAFALTVFFVIRGRGPFAAVGLLLAVHLPLLVGLFSYFDGMIASYSVIANSTLSPKPAELANATAVSLAGPLVAMFLSGPSFLAAIVGSVVRAFTDGEKRE